MYKLFLKSFFDRILSLLAIVILSPIFVIVAIAIKLDSKGPVIFKQERLGLHGKVFRIYKFRSMNHRFDVPVGSRKVFESDPGIKSVGRFIRKTSIDELPQLFNILKGEMSFIGPRPPVTSYPKLYNEYNEFERIRFLVKPGISGLAVVRNREINDWSINIPIDVEYVQNYSFLYDLNLFLRSLLVFFKTDNIYTRK